MNKIVDFFCKLRRWIKAVWIYYKALFLIYKKMIGVYIKDGPNSDFDGLAEKIADQVLWKAKWTEEEWEKAYHWV